MSKIGGAATEGREILAQASGLMRAFEALAAASTEDSDREPLARVADRLTASVLRPLGGALGEPADSAAASAGSQDALSGSLRELAIRATRLRVRAGTAPALLEATAALQDLSCQLIADDEVRLLAHRSKLATIQESLTPSIQCAPDGPYLLTNVETVTDWRGVSLDSLPQAALCRCGASQLKPWCDGSHSVVGFSDAKAPDRVPDRLDTYEGAAPDRDRQPWYLRAFGILYRPCPDRVPSQHRAVRRPIGRTRR